MSVATHSAEVTGLAEQLRLLIEPDQVVELRALHVRSGNYRPCTMGGFFDGQHLFDMAKAAIDVSPRATGTYFTLNGVDKALLARRCNRIERAGEGEGAKDKDTVSRRWLLIDADPVRPAGISATDAEKDSARQVAANGRDYLRGREWPEPMLNDSGNGFHLLYKIDLPADDGGLVKDILWILAHRLNTAEVKIDQSVFNPARICKLPGTWSRKGDHTQDRPHRKAAILECPEPIQVVPRELLEQLATESRAVQEEERQKKADADRARNRATSNLNGMSDYPRLQVEGWLRDRGAGFRVKNERDDKGRQVYVLDCCPFDAAHGKDSCVMQGHDGQLSAKCFHDGCAGNGWEQFKEKIGKPERKHFDPSTLPANSKPGSASVHPECSKPDAPRPQSELVLNRISKLKGKPVRYLVPGRLAAGKTTIIAGRGGSGKSTLTRSLAAAISTGRPAFGMRYETTVAKVLFVVAEDDPCDTILPHLLAEGADLDKIAVLECVKRGDQKTAFTLRPDHIELLREQLERSPEIVLVVIDPITTFVGRAKVDDHKATELRSLLDPLNEIAAKTGAAILLVAHLNKGSGEAVDRIAGSAAYRDAVRAAYFCGEDPEDDARRVLVPVKYNLVGFEQTAISFALETLSEADADRVMEATQFSDLQDWERQIQREQLRRVSYGENRTVDANDVSRGKGGNEKTKVEACVKWMREFLKDFAFPSDEILEEAKTQGYTFDNVKESKSQLKNEGLRNSNQGSFGGGWWSGFGHPRDWKLRQECGQSAHCGERDVHCGEPSTKVAPQSPQSPHNGVLTPHSPYSPHFPHNGVPRAFSPECLPTMEPSECGASEYPTGRAHCGESRESGERDVPSLEEAQNLKPSSNDSNESNDVEEFST